MALEQTLSLTAMASVSRWDTKEGLAETKMGNSGSYDHIMSNRD